jgi:hypothetical protein
MVKVEDMNPDSTFSEFQDLFTFPDSLLNSAGFVTHKKSGYEDAGFWHSAFFLGGGGGD